MKDGDRIIIKENRRRFEEFLKKTPIASMYQDNNFWREYMKGRGN